MAGRNLLLLSNSSVHGSGYLEWAASDIKRFLESKEVKQVLFIPYALKTSDNYTETAQKKFSNWGFDVVGIHTFHDPRAAVNEAQAIFVGGGNTFQLLKALYDNDLITSIRKRVLEHGIPYIGSSAGTNVATVSICTTNDMPIVYPPSFNALKLVPFNINPHFLDADPHSKHRGETREERILQYHENDNMPPVLALREGSLLQVTGNTAMLRGLYSARLYVQGKQPEEYAVGADLSFLLRD